MNGEEQVGLLLVGQRGAAFQRDEGVVGARVDHFGAHAVLHQLAHAQRHIQHQVLFEQALGALGALIVAAMAGIDHHAVDLEAQRADQRTGAVAGVAGGLGDLIGLPAHGGGGMRSGSRCRPASIRTGWLTSRLPVRSGTRQSECGVSGFAAALDGGSGSGVRRHDRHGDRGRSEQARTDGRAARSRMGVPCRHPQFDDQPVRVGQGGRGGFHVAGQVQHHAGDARVGLRHADALQQLVVDRFRIEPLAIEAGACNSGCRNRPARDCAGGRCGTRKGR